MHFRLAPIVLGLVASSLGIAANVIISPNMGLPVPVVGTDPGPDWANNINASLSIIDSHDHTPGHGVQVPPAGLNINSDLTFQGNNATNFRSTRFTAQGAPISGGADLGALYVSGADLYYNDESGNQVRITQGGSVTGSTGTITGLPSGTASAAYSSPTFTFLSATSTPAKLSVGPVTIGTNTASPKTVTIAPPGGLAANYNLTLPNGLPGSTSILSLDTSGNIASVATTGSGSVVLTPATTGSGNVVLATSPTITTPTLNGATVNTALLTVSLASSSPQLTLARTGTNTGSFSIDTKNNLFALTGNVSSTTGLQVTDAGAVTLGATTLSSGATVNGSPLTVSLASSSPQVTIARTGTNTGSFSIDTQSNIFKLTGNVSSTAVLQITDAGAATLGPTTINGTGGNTPHGCTIRTGSSATTTSDVSCNAGEIVTGGGCNSGAGINLEETAPLSATSWRCRVTAGSNTTPFAICCSI